MSFSPPALADQLPSPAPGAPAPAGTPPVLEHQDAPLLPREPERLHLLDQCHILDTHEERDFDDLTRLAALICDAPISLISLVDEERQWFKARIGVTATQTPRRLAFCAHTILHPEEVLVVPDATQDPRFATNDLVTGEMGIRFYAGAPLVLEEGLALGSICVIDKKPRTLNPAQLDALTALARQVVSQIELRRQNHALREAQLEREHFFSLPLDMLCVAGTDGYFRQLNPAFSESLGYTNKEMMARPFLAFVHPDDIEPTKEVLTQLVQGISVLNFENRYRGNDGTYHWLNWRCAPATNGLIYCSARDISARKSTEAKLQEMGALQRAILHSAAHAIIATTPQGIITVFNPAAERMLGYSADEMIGQETPEIIHDAAQVAERAREFSAQLGIRIEPGFDVFTAKCQRHLPNEHEWTYIRKDGRSFPVQLSATALWDGDEIVGYLGIAVDITERKRAEARLSGSEQRFREAIEYSSIGMALVGLDGGWIKVNRALCHILGRGEAELLDCSFQTITHPDDLHADLANVSALLAGEVDHYQMEKRYIHQQGHPVWTRLAVTLVRDSLGQPLYFVSQIEDITERRAAEQQLKTSLSEKNALLQEIHHRVKNNLQVVSSLLSLQSGYIRDPETLTQFQECQGRIRSMALIHEKLYQSETLASVDLKDYLSGLCRIVLSAYSGRAGIRLELALEQVHTSIDTAVPIGLLVNELLTNALKYAFPEKGAGSIRVTLRRDTDEQFTLMVEDDGVGLPENFHVAKAKTLGLRLVGMFVKQLRADLAFQTEAGWTSFRIRCGGALPPILETGDNTVDLGDRQAQPYVAAGRWPLHPHASAPR
jgi:PAS domain S-box-containing protein